MTRTDTFVIGTLVVVFALVATLVGIPSLIPAASTHVLATASSTPARRAVRGRAVPRRRSRASVIREPVDRPVPADRDLVALVFSGLVRHGPGRQRSCPTSPSAGPSTRAARCGRSSSARTRPGRTAIRSRRTTSCSRSTALRDPAYTGPGAGSWNEVTVDRRRAAARWCSPQDAARRLPPGGDPADRPAHLLADVPVDARPTLRPSSGRIGTVRDPFPRRRWRASSCLLRPSSLPASRPDEPADRPAHDSPSPARPTRPVPYLARIDSTFFDSADALAEAYRRGDFDAVSGLPPTVSAGLAATPGEPAVAIPGTTLTAVLFNLRPDHPEFSEPRSGPRCSRRSTGTRSSAASSAGPRRRVGLDPADLAVVRCERRPRPWLRSRCRREGPQACRLDNVGRWLASPKGEGPAGGRGHQPGRGIQSVGVRCRGGRGP